MLKCFIFSNSFGERSLLLVLEHLLKKGINEIFLLKENHHNNESYSVCNHTKITLIEKTEDAISYADLIIILNNGKIPKENIEYIIKKSSELNKPCYQMQYPWKEELLDNSESVRKKLEIRNNIPTILILGLGTHVQLCYTEIMLDRIMRDNHLKFFQFYSKITKTLLKEFDQVNNYSLNANNIDIAITDLDIFIYSLNIPNDVYAIKKYLSIIRHINPDFLILQTDANFNKYDIARNFLTYGGNTTIDAIVKAPFNIYNKYCIYNVVNNYDSSVYDIEDPDLKQKLQFKLFSKIALPNGIVQY